MTMNICLDDRGIEEALVAVLSTQIDEVAVQVRAEPGIDWEERVHRIRAGLKTARATLRLLREGIGERVWQQANEALRDAGRTFSDVRDADVILSCCRRLSGQRRLARALQGLEATFRDRQRQSLERVRSGDTVEQTLDLLSTARHHVESAEARGGWDGVWRGVRHVYGKGRRAWTGGGRAADADQLHELRKRSKDVRFQMRLLTSLAPQWTAPVESRLHELTDHLGDERDLYLFREAFHASAPPDPRRARPVLQYLDGTRRRLLSNVQPLATRLYRDDRHTFVDKARAGFERSLTGRGRGFRRFAAIGAASVFAATTAFWLRREPPPSGPRALSPTPPTPHEESKIR
jgi:CHAD domain-containing protein